MSGMSSHMENMLQKMEQLEDQLKQLCQGQHDSARLVEAIATKSGVEMYEDVPRKKQI